MIWKEKRKIKIISWMLKINNNFLYYFCPTTKRKFDPTWDLGHLPGTQPKQGYLLLLAISQALYAFPGGAIRKKQVKNYYPLPRFFCTPMNLNLFPFSTHHKVKKLTSLIWIRPHESYSLGISCQWEVEIHDKMSLQNLIQECWSCI